MDCATKCVVEAEYYFVHANSWDYNVSCDLSFLRVYKEVSRARVKLGYKSLGRHTFSVTIASVKTQ